MRLKKFASISAGAALVAASVLADFTDQNPDMLTFQLE